MDLRDAAAGDLDAIRAIYDHYVRSSTCTYQRDPDTPDERARWFAAHGPSHPVVVAIQDGEVVGWGSLSPYHARWGYRFTVENSVYVRHDRQRRGVGAALLGELVARARRLGHHAIVAGVDGEQAGSLALHRRAGFVEVGRLREVGHKFDRWLDVVYLQLLL